MSNIGDLYSKALHFNTEENYLDAIKTCREILIIDPEHHDTLMLLGAILGDHGESKEDLGESRSLFLKALTNAHSLPGLMKDVFAIENPLYQLGIWEWRNGNPGLAGILFVILALVSPYEYKDRESTFFKHQFNKFLNEHYPRHEEFIKHLINRILEEYDIQGKGLGEQK
jgi:tetratricopeptide (TPR) repeat protein